MVYDTDSNSLQTTYCLLKGDAVTYRFPPNMMNNCDYNINQNNCD